MPPLSRRLLRARAPWTRDNWAKHFLSFGERITLIQAVLNSILIHVLASLPVPKAWIKQMQRIIQSFLWSGGGEGRRQWVSWKMVCRPRNKGGLGILSLNDIWNNCMGKKAWIFLTNKSLWANHAHENFCIQHKGVGIWNSITPLIRRLLRDSYWEIGRGDIRMSLFCLWLKVSLPPAMGRMTMQETLSDPRARQELLTIIPPAMHGLHDVSLRCFINHAGILLVRISTMPSPNSTKASPSQESSHARIW